jgi:hypothetical protein
MEQPTKAELMRDMEQLLSKCEQALETMRIGLSVKDKMTYLDISWLAHGIFSTASTMQYKASKMAVALEGAKDKWV